MARRVGGVFHLTVSVPSDCIPETVLRTHVSHSLAGNVGTVGAVAAFISVVPERSFCSSGLLLSQLDYQFNGSVTLTSR